MKHGWYFINQHIAAAFTEKGVEEKKAKDIGFHMTDWLDDLESLYNLFESIDERSNEEIRKLVTAFLLHAPNHINAATKLAGHAPIEDVFELGIFEEDVFEEGEDVIEDDEK